MKKNKNLIAISGKIASGKDTVGKIIQYLISQKQHNTSESFRNDSSRDYRGSGWETKSFAYKLKQMVSLLTGISIEDLNKQEIKDSYLGPEWNKYNVPYFFTYKNDFELQAELRNPNVIAQNLDPVHFGEDKKYVALMYKEVRMKVRDLLKKLGTDAMRDNVHTNIHINSLFAYYKPVQTPGIYPGIPFPSLLDELADFASVNRYKVYPKWIITDLRFKNEHQSVKDRGGITIRVNRSTLNRLGVIWKDEHQSETDLDHAEFDHVVDNDGSIEELIEKVKEILIKEQII